MDAMNETDRYWPVPKWNFKLQLASLSFDFFIFFILLLSLSDPLLLLRMFQYFPLCPSLFPGRSTLETMATWKKIYSNRNKLLIFSSVFYCRCICTEEKDGKNEKIWISGIRRNNTLKSNTDSLISHSIHTLQHTMHGMANALGRSFSLCVGNKSNK